MYITVFTFNCNDFLSGLILWNIVSGKIYLDDGCLWQCEVAIDEKMKPENIRVTFWRTDENNGFPRERVEELIFNINNVYSSFTAPLVGEADGLITFQEGEKNHFLFLFDKLSPYIKIKNAFMQTLTYRVPFETGVELTK